MARRVPCQDNRNRGGEVEHCDDSSIVHSRCPEIYGLGSRVHSGVAERGVYSMTYADVSAWRPSETGRVSRANGEGSIGRQNAMRERRRQRGRDGPTELRRCSDA